MSFLLLRFTLRHLHREWFRTLLAVLGVALGVAVYLSIRLANTSVLTSFANTVEVVAGKANLEVTGGSAGIPELLFPVIARTRGVTAAAPLIEGWIPIAQGRRGYPADEASEDLYLLGIDVFRQGLFATSFGGLRENPADGPGSGEGAFLTDPAAIEVTAPLAEKRRLHAGSPIQILVGARRVALRVIGILPDDPLSRAYGGSVGIMDIAAAQELLGKVGRLDRVLLKVPARELPAVEARLRRRLPAGVVVQRPSARTGVVDRMLGAFQLNLEALSLIALFVGMFLIYNTLSSAVVRRRSELGILRSLGVTRGGIFFLVTVEAAIIGGAGATVGIGGGWLLARSLLGLIAATVTVLYVRVPAAGLDLSGALISGVWIVGVMASVVSALAPAVEAASIQPAEVVRQGSLVRVSPIRWRGFLGASLLCAALAAGASWIARRDARPWVSFVASLFILLAFSLLSPLAVLATGRILSRFVVRQRGVALRLGSAFTLASLERVWVVTAALGSAIAMVVGLSIMIGSFRLTVGHWVDQTIRGDVYVSPAGGRASGSAAVLPPEVLARIASLRDAARVDPYRYVTVRVEGSDMLLGARRASVLAMGSGYFAEGGRGSVLAKTMAGANAVLISAALSDRLHRGVGDTLRLPTSSGVVPFRIAGVFEDYTSDRGIAVVSLERYRALWHDSSINSVAVYARSGVSPRVLAGEVTQALPDYRLIVRTNGALRRLILQIFDQTFQVTYVLEMVAVLVALLGIASTLTTLVMQRSRQLATVRALGATQQQISGIVLVEASLIALVAWGLGITCGLTLAAELIHVVLPVFFHWTVDETIRPGVFIATLVLVLPAALLAAFLPAAAARHVEISRALRTD